MPEINAVGVVGAGTMGHGIAQVAAQAGYATVLYDVARELAQQGLQRIGENLDVFGFSLDNSAMAALAGLERGFRTGSHPDSVN